MSSPIAKRLARTRSCPHCKATILESVAVCPECHHRIRAVALRTSKDPAPKFRALSFEGTVRNSNRSKAWEYSVILTVHNEQGEEALRRAMAVGAIEPARTQKFTISVEVNSG